MRYQKKLFVLAELAISAAVLGPQTEPTGRLLVVFAFMLTAAVPICVTKIDPQAATGIEHFSSVREYIHKLRDEFLWLLLKSKLSSHTVVALTIEGWRRYDAVREDTSLAQPTQYLTHFAAKYQTTLVGVESLLFEGP